MSDNDSRLSSVYQLLNIGFRQKEIICNPNDLLEVCKHLIEFGLDNEMVLAWCRSRSVYLDCSPIDCLANSTTTGLIDVMLAADAYCNGIPASEYHSRVAQAVEDYKRDSSPPSTAQIIHFPNATERLKRPKKPPK